MKRKVFLVVWILVFAGLSLAEEPAEGGGGKLGIVFKAGSSPKIGVTFGLTEKIFMRTTLGFNIWTSKLESDEVIISNSESKETSLNFGAGLFYSFFKNKSLNIYGGIEAFYSPQVTKVTGSTDYKVNSYEVNGMSACRPA